MDMSEAVRAVVRYAASNNQHVQGSAKRLWPGLVRFVSALAYHFCLAFTQPGDHLLAEPW